MTSSTWAGRPRWWRFTVEEFIERTGLPGDCLDGYWTPRGSLSALRDRPAVPGEAVTAPPDLLLRMLDPPPVKVRGKHLVDVVRPAYIAMADSPP
jgi:hypothetical protein